MTAPTQAQTQGNRTITVRQDGKGDLRTVLEAIDAAKDGDTIHIADTAIYTQPTIDRTKEKGITLRDTDGDALGEEQDGLTQSPQSTHNSKGGEQDSHCRITPALQSPSTPDTPCPCFIRVDPWRFLGSG